MMEMNTKNLGILVLLVALIIGVVLIGESTGELLEKLSFDEMNGFLPDMWPGGWIEQFRSGEDGLIGVMLTKGELLEEIETTIQISIIDTQDLSAEENFEPTKYTDSEVTTEPSVFNGHKAELTLVRTLQMIKGGEGLVPQVHYYSGRFEIVVMPTDEIDLEELETICSALKF